MPLNIATSNIVALAFVELAMPRPSGFAEDSEQAQDASLMYAHALSEVLEATDWGFASTLVDLPAISNLDGLVVDARQPYAYQIPPDCMALRMVGPASTVWEIDGPILRANVAAPLRVRYTRLIANEETIPAMVRTVIAQRMATLMLPRWGNTDDEARLGRAFEASLLLARRQNARGASVQSWNGLLNPDIIEDALR